MRKIIINEDNLKETDIEAKVIRVKGLIINSKGKILLAHNNYTYQFPGGHVEDNESLNECIKREVKEEIGISLDVVEDAFLNIVTYDSNYFNTGKRVENSIFYYRFITDEEPNFNETHYDELELETDFDLFYVPFNDLESFIEKNKNSGTIDEKIAAEMRIVISVYKEEFGG